jgi:hypothetical protein
MEKDTQKEAKPIVLENTAKLTSAVNLLREKACTATAMSLEEIKGKTIIIKDDIVTIK